MIERRACSLKWARANEKGNNAMQTIEFRCGSSTIAATSTQQAATRTVALCAPYKVVQNDKDTFAFCDVLIKQAADE